MFHLHLSEIDISWAEFKLLKYLKYHPIEIYTREEFH